MNQKKTSLIVAFVVLASFFGIVSPVLNVGGDDLPDYDVAGFVYVDGIPTDGVEVTLSVPGQEDITVTSYYNELYDKHGIYKISFYADQGQYASFIVKVDDNYYIPDPDDFLIDQPHPYSFNNVNLSVDTSSCNLPPDKPTTPSPGHNSEGIGLNPTLSVEVTDPDADTMNVSFYNESDDSLIGTDTSVANGSTASVTWSDLSYNTTYHWYAVADDKKGGINTSDTWIFTTLLPTVNHPPAKPDSPSPQNNSEGIDLNPTLSVEVTDPDDDTMNVSFYNASDDSFIGVDTDVTNGSTASMIWSDLSYNTTYHWYAVANDSQLETRSDTWKFTTKENNPPDKPTNPSPGNNSEDIDLNPALSVYVYDADGDTMDVTFYQITGEGTISIGTDYDVPSDSVASIDWPCRQYKTTYYWYASASDGQASTDSEIWHFTTESKPNTLPIVDDILNQTITEGENFTTINLDDYVWDAEDPDENITWSYSGNIELEVDINTTNRVATITPPDENWNGQETITFTAEDTGGLNDSDNATFTVTPVNDQPVVSNIPDQTIAEGEKFVAINLDDYVEDIEDPDENINWSYSGNTRLTVSIVDQIATITTPNPEWNGQETITFTAEDTGGLNDSDNATFTVTAINDPPKVEIDKPERAVYINNVKKLPRLFRIALIIGDITIEVNATDVDSGIEKVEFYINCKLMGNDTTDPYTYNWTRDRLRLIHIFCIKVIAYDNDGGTAEDKMIVRKFL